MPQLLGLRELPQGAHKKLSTACARLEAAEVRLMTAMLAENSRLESLQLTGSMIGRRRRVARRRASSRRSMPLTLLHLAENNIDVAHGVALVKALREGTPSLTELDLSANPLCGVEEGGRDDFTVAFVDALCGLLGGSGVLPAPRRRWQSSRLPTWRCAGRRATATARTRRGRSRCSQRPSPRRAARSRQLSIGGCKVQDDEAHDLGKGLCHNTTLERLVVDRTALAVQTLSGGERLALAGVDFSEVDATVMAQLLLHNTRLTSVDVSGTRAAARAQDLVRRLRALPLPAARDFGRGALPGARGSAALLDALKECPLEAST